MKGSFCKNCFIILLTVFFLNAVIVIPRALPFTVGEERVVGEKLLYTVRQAFPIIGDPDLQLYINRIGAEVLNVAGIQFFEYHFYLVNSNQFNAFAAPSGLIFFYSNLIESMHTEDEFVSVLAHEIGHVVKRHIASRLEKGQKVTLASVGIALAAMALGGGGAGAQALMAGSLAAGQSAQLYFSRQDEMEADLLAYQWLKAMNRDPRGQRDMLRTMRKITRYRSDKLPQYLLTHPHPEVRLNYVESLLDSDPTILIDETEKKNFAFLRFKYRIMAITERGDAGKTYLHRLIGDDQRTEFEKNMAVYGLSLFDRKEKNYGRSLERLDSVIQQMPDEQILRVDKGVLLSEKGDLEGAKAILEKEIAENPFDIYASFTLADVLLKLNELERSEKLFLDVAAALPEYPGVYYKLGKIQAKRGERLRSRFNLGKYNLYRGKLDLAAANFNEVKKDVAASETMKNRCDEFLNLLRRIRK